MTNINHPINLFWTGGFDSTFRLIQLVLLYQKTVQPFYIIDPDRNSTLHEIRAMEKIKRALIRKLPKAKELIRPTIFKVLNDIPQNKSISESYQRLKQVESIGIQYEWLARFCDFMKISDMEISNETAIFDVDNRTRKLMGADLDKIETDYGVYYKLGERARGKDVFYIYGNFNFPVFDYTKSDMYELSLQKEFDDILKLTWFCHMPTNMGKPCGKCHPCRVVYREGLKWRLPFSAKWRYHTWPFFRKITKTMGIYNRLKWK